MTDHYFSNELVELHYYQFGNGPKNMFCFHGYGMHGKQFRHLEETLGDQYTFYGFDLFFHKQTLLKDQSVAAVRKGITKTELGILFKEFCMKASVERFSIIAYSMGSHYASSLIEQIPEYVDELFIAAPSSFKPGRILTFLSSNRIGNKLLERMALSDSGMTKLLSALKRTMIIDSKAYEILHKEVSSPELRFSFYACASYMRFLQLDADKFVRSLNEYQIRSIFIFGKRDRSYPPSIGHSIISRLNCARLVVIDENHDMINRNFANVLSGLLQ